MITRHRRPATRTARAPSGTRELRGTLDSVKPHLGMCATTWHTLVTQPQNSNAYPARALPGAGLPCALCPPP